MSRCVRILLIGILIIHFFSSSLPAKQSESLTLREVLSLAYEENPKMIEARKAIEAFEGDLLTTRTWDNPQIEAEIGGLKNSEGERGSGLDKIAFKQSFDPPGVKPLKTKMAKNAVRIQQEILKMVWSEVYLSVRETYSKMIVDQKNLELQQSNLNSMRQFFSDIQLKFQSGQTLKNNLQRAKIELLEAESRLLQAEKDLKTDKARINLLLGRSMNTGLEIKDSLKEENLKWNLERLTQSAYVQSPGIKAEELQLDSKNKNLIKEQLSRLPSYSLGLERSDEEDVEDYAALIEISIPLWNFNQGEVKKARAEREAQQVKVENAKNETAFAVYDAYLNAELAGKQFHLAKKSLDEANELFHLAGLRFREGHIDFMNYLDQVKSVLATRAHYYEGLFELNQSINELEKSIYGSLRGEEEFFHEKN